jgi:raffinose/stachyose/melibiose transport system substrate-binding protein
MRNLIMWAGALAALLATPASAEDKVQLRVFSIFDANLQAQWDLVTEAYEKANPNVHVTIENTAGSGAAVYPDVLRTAMASGDPPDTISGPFVKAGQVRALDDLYDKYGWRKLVAPWTLDRVTVGGKIYGVPFRARGMGFWYRADLMKQLGLEEPKTYPEFEQLCAKLKADGKYCVSVAGKFGWHLMRLVDYFLEGTCGPEKHDQLNKLQISWEDPCVVAAYGRLNKWMKQGWLVPDFLGISPDDARLPVYQGDAIMINEGPWFEGVLKGDEQTLANYNFFLPPTYQEPLRYSAFPEQWMIAANAKHPNEGADFINWMTNKDNVNKFPAAFSGSAVIGFQPDCSQTPFECRWISITTSDRPTYPPTDQAFVKELMDGFFEVQSGIISGQYSPEQGAKVMQERAVAWKASQK